MKGAIYHVAIAMVIFSHAKISSFRAKAHPVFHWCLYNKTRSLVFDVSLVSVWILEETLFLIFNVCFVAVWILDVRLFLVFAIISATACIDLLTCFCRFMEGTGTSYHYDRYPHSSAVVHLRLSQGLLPSPPSPTPRGTREPQEETPSETTTSRLSLPITHLLYWTCVNTNENPDNISVFNKKNGWRTFEIERAVRVCRKGFDELKWQYLALYNYKTLVHVGRIYTVIIQ